MKGFTAPKGFSKHIALLAKADGLEAALAYTAAIEAYAADGTEPEGLTESAQLLFDMARADYDATRRRSEAGKRNSTIAQAMPKQCLSNGEAMPEQCPSKEREEEEERKEERKDTPPTPPTESQEERKEVGEEIEPISAEPAVITFSLNDGSEFPITQDVFTQLAELYPALDTMKTLRDIKGWCLGNPTKRKTKRGAMRFVHSWFSKQQDRSAPAPWGQWNNKPRRLTPEEVYALPAINPWEDTG